MPSAFDVLVDYEQRSLAHQPGTPEHIDAPGLWRGVGYRLGSRHLASSFNEVVEVITVPSLTPIPGGLNWLLGLANVRGNLLPMVDLKLFLEGERTVQHENQRALVVRQPGGNVAVLIDELHGQRHFVDAQRCEAGGIAEGRYADYVGQAYRLGDITFGVFSMTQLTRAAEFRQAAL
ncbi:MAG: chemotaxis protein CheW [Lysobacteraceae bacterium]